ncbi:MAG TPA: sugar ABC transporter permease [Clostridiales bacterium]|nr:sugar ABC transporter permease [Clostridiales bacterium]
MALTEHKKWRISANLVLSFMSLLAVLPFILLIIASLTDESVAITNGYSYFPEKWSFLAYDYILREAAMISRAYGMTVLVTTIGTTVNLLISSMLAYMLSKRGLPGGKVINFLVIFTMLFNGGLVPTYLVYTKTLGIKDTIFALIVPALLSSAFLIMLMRNYFEHSIPESLYESAYIDGAGEFYVFYKIVLPLSKPILATVGLLVGIAYWNDWQNGLYYLNDTRLYTIQNILNDINRNIQFLASNSGTGVDISELPTTTVRMAIAVVGILPILILYPFFQRYFVKGITMGAVKG